MCVGFVGFPAKLFLIILCRMMQKKRFSLEVSEIIPIFAAKDEPKSSKRCQKYSDSLDSRSSSTAENMSPCTYMFLIIQVSDVIIPQIAQI